MTRQFLVVGLILLLYLLGFGWALYDDAFELQQVLLVLPLVVVGLYIFLFHFKYFIGLTVFFIPLTMNIKDVGGGFGLSVPMELMLLLAMGGGVYLLVRDGLPSLGFLRHPISGLILLQVLWALVTTVTSSDPSTSLKFLVSRVTYLLFFYLFLGKVFEDYREGIRLMKLYLLGFVPVMIYALVRLGQMGLQRKYSPVMAEPFFDDHTIFGACLAMLLPAAFLFWRQPSLCFRRLRWKGILFLLLGLTVCSLALSFSRAAWLSILFAVGLALLMRLRIPFSVLVGMLVLGGGLVFYQQDSIVDRLLENKSVSGKELVEIAKSVTNISSDVSNAERVNRWASALAMWEDRPWLGFGPGTYEQSYGPYQRLSLKTRISTMKGDRGDGHSEYLNALSEQGLPGLVIWVALVLVMLRTGMNLTYRNVSPLQARWAQALILGLVTYFIHGLVNSFLDIEKAASLFWLMAAMLAAMAAGQQDLKPSKFSGTREYQYSN